MAASTETKAAALEGLDFIETEEDVKAVEAATLKIQSTFRGKKIRSKFAPASGAKQAEDKKDSKEAVQVNKSAGQQQQQQKSSKTTSSTTATTTTGSKQPESSETELSKRIGEMQVNDNSNQEPQIPGGLPEDEAERAATKIQAGFKGYKTRKELEGKLPAGSAGGAQQATPGGCHATK